MAILSFDVFLGLNLAISPVLVPRGAAGVSEHSVLRSGEMRPLPAIGPSVRELADSSRNSLFRYEQAGVRRWFSWPGEVHAAAGPLADDKYNRVYWTDSAYPKMASRDRAINGGTAYPNASYRLGVPAPTAAPVVSAPLRPGAWNAAVAFPRGETAVTGVVYHDDDYYIVGTRTDKFYVYADGKWDAGTDLPAAAVTPRSIEVKRNGDVLVLDAATNKIYKHNGSRWNRGMAIPAAETQPTGMALTSDGKILVCGNATDKIYTHAKGSWDSGIAVPEPGGVRAEPRDVAVRSDGTILLLDILSDRIYSRTSGGDSWDNGLPVPTGETAPLGLDADADDTFYLTGNDTDIIHVRPQPEEGIVQEDVTTAYVYTYVTEFGEEGPPSPASDVITTYDGLPVAVTMPSDSFGKDRAFGTGALKRLYRANAGSSGAVFQFVAQIPVANTDTTDSTKAFALGEALPSETWVRPPDDAASEFPEGPLRGLTALPNGVFAGFAGHVVHFSEPHLPHAWPRDYRVGIERKVVALGTIPSGLIVLTEGHPFLLSGVHPSSMAPSRIPFEQGCLSPNSVVAVGGGVMYFSPDGLARLDSNGGEVVSLRHMRPEDWNSRYTLGQLRCFRWEGTYVALPEPGSTTKGFIYDPTGSEATWTDLSPGTVGTYQGGWSDPTDGSLYVIDGSDVKKFAAGASNLVAAWESHAVRRVSVESFSYCYVSLDPDAVVADAVTTVTVFSDERTHSFKLEGQGPGANVKLRQPASAGDSALRDIPVPYVIMLPPMPGYSWKVRVEGNTPVRAVHLSDDPFELQTVTG